jgi:hypothetical protein
MRDESFNHSDSSAPDSGWSAGIPILSSSPEVSSTFLPTFLAWQHMSVYAEGKTNPKWSLLVCEYTWLEESKLKANYFLHWFD